MHLYYIYYSWKIWKKLIFMVLLGTTVFETCLVLDVLIGY